MKETQYFPNFAGSLPQEERVGRKIEKLSELMELPHIKINMERDDFDHFYLVKHKCESYSLVAKLKYNTMQSENLFRIVGFTTGVIDGIPIEESPTLIKTEVPSSNDKTFNQI